MTTHLINININDIKISVPFNLTILQACEFLDIYIPRFCYHDKLSVAGNCRMCLVEIENSSKPVVSCSYPIINNMKIYTNTPLVKKARENILEFLLVNHPLDCPICDQGGECDLQEQTLLYGSDKSRFYEIKRVVEDKNCGPLIKTIMTRCIHCTRCVRFINEMTNFKNLGTINRGFKVEISTFLETIIKTELSGNIIDLCPVGALTSKPYAFNARPWELKSIDSFDIMDAVGSNIKVDFKGNKLLRILPKFNKHINEEWISDKTRFFIDGLQYQRITKPSIFFNLPNITNIETTWMFIFNKLSLSFIKSKNIGIILGDFIDIETGFLVKHFVKTLKLANVINLNNLLANTDFSFHCHFPFKMNDIIKINVCLLIGTNPRFEASIYNLKVLKQIKLKKLEVFYIGSKISLNYFKTHINTTLDSLIKISEGKHYISPLLKKSQNNLFIYNNKLNLYKKNFNLLFIKKILLNLKKSISNCIILNSDISAITSLNLNLKSNKNSLFKYNLDNKSNLLSKFDLIYLINVDITKYKFLLNNKTTVIYQNSHNMNNISKIVNFILPTKTLFEKKFSFSNIEGKVQKNIKVVNINKKNKENFYILNNFLNYLSYVLKIKNKKTSSIFFISPNFLFINKLNLTLYNLVNVSSYLQNQKFLINYNIKNTINLYYNTNIITKSSPILSKCQFLLKNLNNFNITN